MTTRTQPPIIQDIPPRGIVSAYVNAPFDKGKKALEEQGYSIISLEENAQLRIQEGKDAYVSKNGNWTREGVIYVPKKGIFLTKNSPIMENPEQATDFHRNNQEFYLTTEQVEKALEDCVELKNNPIPTNRFADNEICVYAFGSETQAKAYGDFLKQVGIGEMPVWTAEMQDNPFERKMWFSSLDDRSVLDGYGGGLDYDSRVRGVLSSAEGTQKKSGKNTPNNLSKILRDIGITGELEKEILSRLNQ